MEKLNEIGQSAIDDLKELASSRNMTAGEVQRARIVLSCLSGESIRSISSRLQISPSTVVRWKKRFCEKGLSGLSDNHRSGRPSKYGDEFRKSVLEKLESEPPAGYHRAKLLSINNYRALSACYHKRQYQQKQR